MTKLKIICVLNSGGPDYDWSYVQNLKNSLRGRLRIPFEFICYSNLERPDVKPLQLGLKRWWSKVEVFRETGPCLFFDLDTVVVGDLTALAERIVASPGSFWMLRPVRPGRRRRFSHTSGIMAWHGDFRFFCDEFIQPAYREDQRWFIEQAAVHGLEIGYVNDLVEPGALASFKFDFRRGRISPALKIVFFHGRPRPHEVGFPFWTVKGEYEEMQIEQLRNMYAHGKIFLCCSGPSFAGVDHALLDRPGIMTMGVNNCPSVFRPNLWIHVDPAEKFLPSVWADPSILKFSPRMRQNVEVQYRKEDLPEGVEMPEKVYYGGGIVNYRLNASFDPETYLPESTVSFGCTKEGGGGRSVLLAAIKVLYMLGFRTIYLLGVDFKMVDGEQNYCFEQDRTPGAVRGNNNTYSKLMERFELLKPYFEESGLQVFNCNPDSELKAFPFLALEDAVAHALERFPDPDGESTFGRYDPRKKNPNRKVNRRKRGKQGQASERPPRWRTDLTVEVKKQIALTGLSRSGTHAVSDWILAQHAGRVEFRNNLFHGNREGELFHPWQTKVPERWYLLPSMPREVDQAAPIDAMLYTYENQPGNMFEKHNLVHSWENVKVVLIRDPFNLLASLGKHIEIGGGFWFAKKCTDSNRKIDEVKLKNFAEMWLSHVRLMDREDVVPVLYNRWADSAEYRDRIAGLIGVDNRSDSSMDRVPENGKGSSFDRKVFDGRGGEMNTQDRWQYFKDEGWFRRFFQNNPEVVAASERLFGHIPGTEYLGFEIPAGKMQ